MAIKHLTGIPYNPPGQGIVERAHQILKNMLFKLTSEEETLYASKGYSRLLLNHALFVLNFLSCDEQGRTAADCLWHPSTAESYKLILWQDPLSSIWQGPDLVLILRQGHACRIDMTHQQEMPDG